MNTAGRASFIGDAAPDARGTYLDAPGGIDLDAVGLVGWMTQHMRGHLGLGPLPVSLRLNSVKATWLSPQTFRLLHVPNSPGPWTCCATQVGAHTPLRSSGPAAGRQAPGGPYV